MLPRPGPPWNILVPSLFSNTHFLHGFRNIVPREIVDRQNESPSATLPTGSLNAPSGKLRFKSWSDLNPERGARRKLFSRRIFYVTSMRKHPLWKFRLEHVAPKTLRLYASVLFLVNLGVPFHICLRTCNFWHCLYICAWTYACYNVYMYAIMYICTL